MTTESAALLVERNSARHKSVLLQLLSVNQSQLCAEAPLYASWTVVLCLRRITAMPLHHMSASRVQGLL